MIITVVIITIIITIMAIINNFTKNLKPDISIPNSWSMSYIKNSMRVQSLINSSQTMTKTMAENKNSSLQLQPIQYNNI